MPMNPDSIQDLKKKLNKITVKQSRLIKNNRLIKEFSWKQRIKLFQETNLKLKRKLKPLQEIQYEFNPNSSKQLQELLYEYLQLPVIDLTDTKQPATGEDTLSKLIQHLENNSD
jgi:DNA polymerase-1